MGGNSPFLSVPGGEKEGDDLRMAINLGSAGLAVGEMVFDRFALVVVDGPEGVDAEQVLDLIVFHHRSTLQRPEDISAQSQSR